MAATPRDGASPGIASAQPKEGSALVSRPRMGLASVPDNAAVWPPRGHAPLGERPKRASMAPPSACASDAGFGESHDESHPPGSAGPSAPAIGIGTGDRVARGRKPTDGCTEGTDQSQGGKPLRQVTLEGTLTVSCPGGPVDVRALFDTGSEADAVSMTKAVELQQYGVSWGESGGNLKVADSGEVRPVGSLRLLLTAEPKRVSQGSNRETSSLSIPRSLTFCTDAEIVNNLTAEVIIGYRLTRSSPRERGVRAG